jgi:hypothetical protein
MIKPKKSKRFTINIYVGLDSQNRPMLEYIAFDETNATVEPGRFLQAPSKAKVRWSCTDGDFEIIDSALQSGKTPSGEATDYKTLPDAGGSTLTLKYTARVYTAGGIVEEDPQIFIDDSSFF